MNSLRSAYDTIQKDEKLPFDVEAITKTLMSEPLSISRSDIFETPSSVTVKKSRSDYMNQKVVQAIRDKFDVEATCMADMLVFM
jgi:hypothetical protein